MHQLDLSLQSPRKADSNKSSHTTNPQHPYNAIISSRLTSLEQHKNETAGEEKPSILRETVYEKIIPPPKPPEAITPSGAKNFQPADKEQMHNWTLNQFHTQSLNPHVSEKEIDEYNFYIRHPQNLPLVTSTDLPSDANIDYLEYVNKAGGSAFDDLDDEEASMFGGGVGVADLEDYADFVEEKVDPLTVMVDDLPKKRYKAYRQWLRGKSLFKQAKMDPEFVKEGA